MDEVEYLNWRAGVISDYRHEALRLWVILGIVLYGYFEGYEAFFRLKTWMFFLLGGLVGSLVIGRINFAIIMAMARRRGSYLASLAGTDQHAKTLHRDRLIIRFFRESVTFFTTIFTFWALERFF
jgi:hypothetical protein